MPSYSNELYKKTIAVWQPSTFSIMSHEDAREITQNIIGSFSLLLEWENNNEKNKEKE